MNNIATAERLHALYYICLAASLDYEKTGVVSANVMEQMRNVINEPSSTKNVAPTDCSTTGEIGQFHQVLAAD
jgi:hypothetical protein